MMRMIWAALAIGVSLLAGGCAHPISLTADAASVVGSAGGTKADRKVGLVITEEQRKREVVSPGGGGDKLSYFPYRDLETGLYMALSEHFTGVSIVGGAADAKVKSEGLTLFVTPEISTTSHSPSLLTWPPTVFTVELACTVKDANDRVLKQFRVQGEGRAEFDEFKSDPSLSAKRASNDAIKKLVRAIGEFKASLR
jgi:hypothetical protein